MKIKNHLPNFITLINVFAGCVSIVFAFQQDWKSMVISVVVALLADFLDGFVARALKVSSSLGKELDSLADAVTFGVLPGMVVFQLLSNYSYTGSLGLYLPYAGFVFPVLAVLRLAKFNIDTSQTYYFKGIPTPAATAFVIALPFVQEELNLHYGVLLGLVVIVSLLMVSNFKMIALKFKDYTLGNNIEKVLLVVGGLSLLFAFGWASFFYIILFYIVLSFLFFSIKKD